MFLITRPIDEALVMQQKLANVNIPSFIEPLLTFHPLYADLEKDYTVLIITSANALKALKKGFCKIKPLIVVGTNTQLLAYEKGFKTVIWGGNTVSELANLIINNFSTEKLLYLSGKEVSFPLDNFLAAQKIKITRRVIYKMLPSPNFSRELQAAFHRNKIEGVSLFSYRTGLVFLGLLKLHGLVEKLNQLKIFTFSTKITELFLGYKVYTPSMPNFNAFLELVVKNWNNSAL